MTKLAATEIATLDPYKFMATLGKRVIHPGGRASTDSLLARSEITSEHQVLDVGCGVGTTAIEIAQRFGAHVTTADWVRICQAGGLVDIETETGPFDMMTARGFLADEAHLTPGT